VNAAIFLLAALATWDNSDVKVTVASKSFTESSILGEILKSAVEHQGYKVEHKDQLGGTGLVWGALKSGDIDLYPDYTGTITRSLLNDESLTSYEQIREALAEDNVRMSNPLGFNNSYEIGVRKEVAEQNELKTISDLRKVPDLRFGFGSEFMDRGDGWPGLQKTYQLPQRRIRSMEHALSYRAIGGGGIDAMDVYGTDANIKEFDVTVLDDDLDYFPKYEAVILYRDDLQERAPDVVAAIALLEGSITNEDIIGLNAQVDIEEVSPARAGNNFLAAKLGIGTIIPPPTTTERRIALISRILKATLEHMLLVVVSLGLAICVAVPLGVIAAKNAGLGHIILTTAEIIQTIPGLALLILLIGPLELLHLNTVGPLPAIIALFLYSLLPIIRNTYAGIQEIPNAMRESAEALGLTPQARLFQIELPLASRMILTGIKTTAVINVGYATLGGLIGAGGYGETILTGLYRSSVPKMLEGAIPAAILALVVKSLFELSEKYVVPKGLRLNPTH